MEQNQDTKQVEDQDVMNEEHSPTSSQSSQSYQQGTQLNQSSQSSEPGKFTRRLQEYKRVLKVTKKPSKNEFFSVVKVTGLGILIIGLLGFLVLSVKILLKNIFV